MNIPKAKQIIGLRKAIANRNTPQQFLPSLKKRLAKLTGTAVMLFALCGCAARPAVAQTPVTIQPYQQTLATNASCTGTEQDYPVNNRNLNQHTVAFQSSLTFSYFEAEIDAITPAGKVRISDQLFNSLNSSGAGVLLASGYYPQVQVQVTCTAIASAKYSVNYSGSSLAGSISSGATQSAQLDKFLAYTAASNASATYVFQTPFGSASGFLFFTYSGSGPSGSTLNIQCAGQSVTPYQVTLTLATPATAQNIPLPPMPCVEATVIYTSGGASATTYQLEYLFSPPGLSNPTLGTYTHITGTTATPIKPTAGIFLGINLNTSGSGTISVFDLATASCTGTPSTNTIAVLTIAATENARSIPFNQWMQNGICVKASAAMDITVSSQ